MSRRFSADNSEVRWAINAATDLTAAYSFLIIVRRRATGFAALIANHDSGGTIQIGAEFDSGGHVLVGNDGAARAGATTITSLTDWFMIAFSKAAGTATPLLLYKNLTTGAASTSENAGGTLGNPSSASGGTIRIGEWEDVDDANANVAAVAEWQSIALTKAQFDECWANNRTSDIWNCTAGHPAFLAELNQAAATDNVPDLAGNTTWGLTNGTTVDGATDPPSWTYDGTGSGAAVYVPPRRSQRPGWRPGMGPRNLVERRWQSAAPANQTITAGGAAFQLASAGADPAPQPVNITAGGATVALAAAGATPAPQPVTISGQGAAVQLAAGGSTPTSVISITAGGASFTFTGAGATPAPQPVNITAGGAALALNAGGATPAPQPVSVTGGGAAFQFAAAGATPAPQPVTVTGGGAAFQLAGGGTTPTSSVTITAGGAAFQLQPAGATPVPGAVTVTVGGAAFAFGAGGASTAPQPVSTTVGGASFAIAGGGGSPAPQAVNITAKGAAFSIAGGGASPQVLVGQTVQVGGAAFRITVGGTRPRSGFTYALDDTDPFTYAGAGGFTYTLDDTDPFDYGLG